MDIKSLKTINENKLNYYLQLKQKDSNEQIEEQIELHTRIKTIFDKDEAIFFKIPMEDALKILSTLVPKEELRNVYSDLMSPKSFEDLRKQFKL